MIEENSTDLLKPIRYGPYNPNDYCYLNVDDEIQELWKDIEKYRIKEIELPLELHCFVPNYIPAVGDPDLMLKPLRPDQESESLGITEIDEPFITQSNPTLINIVLEDPELAEIFQFINFEPKEIELEVNLKCFLPEYIPVLGDVCLHLQPPRPDGVNDGLGTLVLDEPASIQSETVNVIQLAESVHEDDC